MSGLRPEWSDDELGKFGEKGFQMQRPWWGRLWLGMFEEELDNHCGWMVRVERIGNEVWGAIGSGEAFAFSWSEMGAMEGTRAREWCDMMYIWERTLSMPHEKKCGKQGWKQVDQLRGCCDKPVRDDGGLTQCGGCRSGEKWLVSGIYKVFLLWKISNTYRSSYNR